MGGLTVLHAVLNPAAALRQADRPLTLSRLDEDAEDILRDALTRGAEVGTPSPEGLGEALGPGSGDARPVLRHAGHDGHQADLEPVPRVLAPRATPHSRPAGRQRRVPRGAAPKVYRGPLTSDSVVSSLPQRNLLASESGVRGACHLYRLSMRFRSTGLGLADEPLKESRF